MHLLSSEFVDRWQRTMSGCDGGNRLSGREDEAVAKLGQQLEDLVSHEYKLSIWRDSDRRADQIDDGVRLPWQEILFFLNNDLCILSHSSILDHCTRHLTLGRAMCDWEEEENTNSNY